MALPFKNNRRSWLPWIKKDRKMHKDEAVSWLSQFIGKNLRIHASDGRVFGGQLKCTDKDRNIILALAHEYRAPSAEIIRKAIQDSGNPSTCVPWNSRFVGLVVVPGHHVTKIEFEESTVPGQRNPISL